MSQLCRLFTILALLCLVMGCKKEATAPASAPADAPLPPPPRALFDPVPDGVGGHAHLHLGTLQAFGAAGRLAQPLGAVAFDHADRLRAVAGDGTIWAWGLEAPAPLPMATDPAPGLASGMPKATSGGSTPRGSIASKARIFAMTWSLSRACLRPSCASP